MHVLPQTIELVIPGGTIVADCGYLDVVSDQFSAHEDSSSLGSVLSAVFHKGEHILRADCAMCHI